MADIATWGRHTFEISSKKVYGFEELKIKAQRKTKDKEKDSKTYGKQTYVTKDPSQPTEVSFKAKLYSALGVDAKNEAKKWLEDAHLGQKARLVINGKELVPCTLRLVTAEVSEIEINTTGDWVSCEVSCTLKQAGPWSKMSTTDKLYSGDGGTGSSKKSSGSSKKKGNKGDKPAPEKKSLLGTAAHIVGVSKTANRTKPTTPPAKLPTAQKTYVPGR